MKIAVLALTRGRVSGGFKKILDKLVPLLRTQPDVTDLQAFVPADMAGPDVRTWPRNDDVRGFRELRRSLADFRPDVLFVPTVRVVRVEGVPLVTMIQNMEPLEVPFGGNRLGESLKNIVRAQAARKACRVSDRVLAVSNHVRDFLVDEWRVPSQRVGVVYMGTDTAPADVPEPASLRQFVGRRFLFTAGSIRPARGLEDVVSGMPALPDDVQLLIAGSVDHGTEHYKRRIQRLADKLGLTQRVHWLGQVDYATMSWCYRNAAAFVMTSRAEACPNIVLEALAEGAVSLSTTHEPMPELFGDAARYYQERDAADLGVKLRDLLAAPDDVHQRLRETGRRRAAMFSWESAARHTVAELQRARGAR